MNKAFTRETDDTPPAPLEDRPVSSELNLVTPRGARHIKDQITAIENRLAAEVNPVIRSELRRDLHYWLARHSSMQIIKQNRDTNTVGFGSRVTIRRGAAVVTISIVGEDESEPKAGLISWTAPLARALDGAKVGEEVGVEVGRGETVTVLAISYNEDNG
jgi:transcription elongation GreA/GreB family factor